VFAVRLISRQDLLGDRGAPAEFGLAICMLCLISPLTEWIYLTLLVIPLVTWAMTFLLDSPRKIRQPGSAALLVIYGTLCLPLFRFEGPAWNGMAAGGLKQAFYVFYGAAFLYPLIAAFFLAVFVVDHHSIGWRRGNPRTASGASDYFSL
jgi:hypothetical protein